jgi:hypothetical protein
MSDMNKPMANEEIRELLTMTLHGPLPTRTMYRVFATLAEVQEIRAENERLRDLICRAAPLAWVHNHADPDAIEYAHQWEIEAGKLIGLNNPDQEE